MSFFEAFLPRCNQLPYSGPFLDAAGTSGTSILFPETITSTPYSLCTVSKYLASSGPYSRIFQGSSANWLHGALLARPSQRGAG